MGTFYLDIETTGLDEVEHKIITIQYAELERGTGRQLGELTVLKEWELGEKEMLRQFIEDSPITSKNVFDFAPVGYNLGFEHKFLLEKSAKYDDLFPISILSRPCIDLRSIGEIENYIKNETDEFVKWYEWLHKTMPELRTQWNNELN